MGYLKIGLALLKLANLFLGWVKDSQLISAGQDKEIAMNSIAILKRTQAAKEIDTSVEKMDDASILKSLAASGDLRD